MASGSVKIGSYPRAAQGSMRNSNYNTYASRPSVSTDRGEIWSEGVRQHSGALPKRASERFNVKDKLVEVAKPIFKEKYVEVPDVVYVEKVVEVPEKVVQTKIREVERVEYRDRVVEVPKVITREKIVEVPEIQYKEVPYEKIVEVPEIQEQVVIKEVPVTQYVDKVVNEYIPVRVPEDVVRHIPVPIVATTKFNYELPQPKPVYQTKELNVYVPRFIEVPIPTEFLDPRVAQQAQHYVDQVAQLAAHPGASLRDIEELAGAIKDSGVCNAMQRADYQSALMSSWKQGEIDIKRSPHEVEYSGSAIASVDNYSAKKMDNSRSRKEHGGSQAKRTSHHRRNY